MGIFDVVRIEEGIDVPGFPGDPHSTDWQTKDLRMPASDVYKIKSDGYLIMRQEAYGEVWWGDQNYHGSFEFHTTWGGQYWSYDVFFYKGELDRIEHRKTKDLSS